MFDVRVRATTKVGVSEGDDELRMSSFRLFRFDASAEEGV